MARIIFLVLISIIFANCNSKYDVLPTSIFTFEFEKENDQITFDRDDAITQNSKGFFGTMGYQTIGAATAGANSVAGGLKFKFNLESEDDFSTDEFLSKFQKGNMFTLGKWENGNSLYFGHRDENKENVIRYVSTPDDSSNLIEIVSSAEFIGENEDGEDFYKVEVSFEAKMKNEEDDTDITQIKNGVATLYVIDFSSK